MRRTLRYLAPVAALVAAVAAVAIVAVVAAEPKPAAHVGRSGASRTKIALALDSHGPVHTMDLRSAACPTHDRGAVVVSARPGADHTLVPSGPVSVTLCRYNGMNARAGAGAFTLTGIGAGRGPAAVAKLGAQLDAIPPTPGVAYSCPMDDGSAIIAYFGYRSGVGDPVRIGENGCNAISNGHVSRLGLDRPVIARLERLIRPLRTGVSYSSRRAP